MKRIITPLVLIGAWWAIVSATVPQGYYTNAVGKHDEGLMTALEGIIFTHTELGYNYMWIAYDSTDVGADGYYIDMYSTCKYNKYSTHVGGASHVGQGINREHSFPKSWFGGQVAPMFTDLTMLIPTDAYVNQRRSDNPYGICAHGETYTYQDEEMYVTMLGKLGTSTYNGYTKTVFEPDDEYKGDFARIYFYMVTCYKGKISEWPGCDQLDYAQNGYKAFSDWSMRMLMEWHRADPVSQKELDRNEAVYRLQGNRNPYVDHPELAEYIWGTKQHSTWTDGGDIPQPIVKEVPVMLSADETAVEPNAFRADWTSGGDVSSYTLKVTRQSESGATLLMSENFSGVNANNDGNTDIGESLDDYTDNPGWKGYKVYTAAGQSLKMGTSNAIGHLISPNLQLGSTVTVVFKAKNWISSSGSSDNSSMIISCGNASQTVALSDSPEQYTVVLNGCTDSNVKLAMNAVKKRSYIYSVDIYDGDLTAKAPRRQVVEEGDSTWRMVSGIVDTCYTVRALAAGDYEYMVKAIYNDGTQSVWSNIEHVTIVGNGDEPLMGDVNGDGEVNISDVTTLIDYLLAMQPGDQFDAAADVNGDGEINITDVTAIIDLLLSM